MQPDPINLPNIVAEVRAAFEAYEAALLRNDTAALNDFFWDSPLAIRYGIAEHNFGIAAIRAWRNLARPVSPSRRIRTATIVTFGKDAASVCAEFVADDTPDIGRQTQMWVRLVSGWRIVAAHVSLITPASHR